MLVATKTINFIVFEWVSTHGLLDWEPRDLGFNFPTLTKSFSFKESLHLRICIWKWGS